MRTRDARRWIVGRGRWRELALAVTAIVLAVEVPGRMLHEWGRASPGVFPGVIDPDLRSKLEHDLIEPSTRIRYDYDMFLGWRARPNQHGLTYRINESGRRADVKYGSVGDDTVLLTGGSAAWSVGASSNAQTLGARLERHVNALVPGDRRVSVLNLAEQAYGLRQETVTILDAMRDGAPGVVVFYDGVNDAHTVFMGKDPEHFRTYGSFPDILADALREYERVLLRGSTLTRWSMTLRALGHAARHLGIGRQDGSGSAFDDEQRSMIRAFFKRHLVSLNGTLRRLGTTPIFVLQPIGYVGRRPSAEEPFLEDGAGRSAGWWREAYGTLEEVYEEVKGDGVVALTLVSVFEDEDRPVFIDATHLNDLGNDLVARALAPAVAEAMIPNPR